MHRTAKQEFLPVFTKCIESQTAKGTKDTYPVSEHWQQTTDSARNLGQVATPKAVAKVMAKWVTSKGPETVMDPAAGLGNLLHECWLRHKKSKFIGIERDEQTFKQAIHTAPRGTLLRRGDYMLESVPPADGMIANPPYVKAHRLQYSESDWRLFEDRLGMRLDRLTNLYALFLIKIWEDLAEGGRAAVIVPAEFLNANFGIRIKERLLSRIRPSGIAIFGTEINLFEAALTTSCIVFLEKIGQRRTIPAIKVQSVDEANAFVDSLLAGCQTYPSRTCIDLIQRKAEEKWLNILFNGHSGRPEAALKQRVGDYFRCSRGIATGGNEYFCLRQSELERHGLKSRDFDFCVAKAADVDGLVFTESHLKSLVKSDKRCFLLNPESIDPAMAKYLGAGEDSGISSRFLPSHRKVWYLPENRAAADVWVAVFSRESVKFILNDSGAKNLTCFHGLYAKPQCQNLAPLITLFLNSSSGKESFSRVNRFYGNGLNKLEPKDVEAMPCPTMPPISDVQSKMAQTQLATIQGLPECDRQNALDELCTEWLDLS